MQMLMIIMMIVALSAAAAWGLFKLLLIVERRVHDRRYPQDAFLVRQAIDIMRAHPCDFTLTSDHRIEAKSQKHAISATETGLLIIMGVHIITGIGYDQLITREVRRMWRNSPKTDLKKAKIVETFAKG